MSGVGGYDEFCIECGMLTGNERSEDSLYCDFCDAGPFCYGCWAVHIEWCCVAECDEEDEWGWDV